MPNSLRAVAPVVIAVLMAGCNIELGPSDRYKAEFHYTLKPADRLSLDNPNGEIEIAGWDEPSVEVTGTRYASTQELLDSVRVEVHESPGLDEIRTVHSDNIMGSQGARYLIRAPRKMIIDRILSSNGAVRIHDMMGPARVHTSNGSIRIENLTGGVDAQTSNGSIELDSVTGKMNLRTSNGRVRAEEVAGACEAETSNGSVTLRFKDAADGPTHVHTSNGSVELTMTKAPADSIRVETTNGSVTLDLPSDTKAVLSAESSHKVSSDFPVANSGDSDKESHHLEGTINGGGPRIELRTSNGGIHLRKGGGNTN